MFKAYNPNKRSTYFKHKTYTNYIANSEYVIRNKETTHGLFGIVDKFPNIQSEENLSNIINYIDELAKAKVPIYRGLVSLTEFDAERLGYYDQEKWKKLLENRLPSIAEKLNIKFSDLQYLGAVHYEEGHPHLQFFVWSKTNRNYFIKYKEINKMRNEFINDVFKEDLLPIYQDKDLLKNTTGSIKYEYLKAYPEILAKVNEIAIKIIVLSPQCQREIDKYIKAKQQLLEFQYTDIDKLNQAKEKVKEDAEKEIIK